MNSQRPDAIDLLKKELAHHVEQIKRLNMAIAVLEGGTLPGEKNAHTQKTPWAAAIDALFEDYEQLSFADICQKLAERGIPEALDDKNRGTISGTLNRKTRGKSAPLVRVGRGIFRRRTTNKTQHDLDEVLKPAGNASVGEDAPLVSMKPIFGDKK